MATLESVQAWLASLKDEPQLLLPLAVALFMLWNLRDRFVRPKANADESTLTTPQSQARKPDVPTPLPAKGYPPIEPRTNFDWKTTEPEKYRPFKGKYHLTMGMMTSRYTAHKLTRRLTPQPSKPSTPPTSSQWTKPTSRVSSSAPHS